MSGSSRLSCYGRIACTVAAILMVQAVVCTIAALPVAIAWTLLAAAPLSSGARALAGAAMAAPSYVAFALTLLVVSPLANRLTGALSPADIDARIADFEWPLLRWARYMVAGHVVRLFAGTLLRGSPMWTFYLRMNGARLGRRVFVNTLAISDHNLLEFGDDTIIGADVHLSGHTVEGGRLITGAVRLGRDVTVGVGSVVCIGTVIGDGCQVGAMSLVPKSSRLAPNGVYVGAPIRRIDPGRADDSTTAA